MAILFVTHKFPPSVGGMQRQSYELINGVRKRTKSYMIAKRPNEHTLWFFLLLIWRINKLLRQHANIKVIHCNDGVVASVCAVLLKTKVPITATIHGLDIVYPGFIFQKYIIPRLHKLHKIFAVSEATRTECIARGFDPNKVKVILNGVDHSLAQVQKDPDFIQSFKKQYNIDINKHKIILSTGRAVKRKGFSWFVNNVLPGLPEDVRYVIAGPTQDTKALSYKLLSHLPKYIRHHLELFWGYPSDSFDLSNAISKSDGKAIHIGQLPWSALKQLMAHAQLMVMPNQKIPGDMEGFGLVALESGLLGTYVVVSDIEGIRSAVTPSVGTLIPAGDRQIWINTIGALLEDCSNLNKKASQCKAYIKNEFGWHKMASQYFNELSLAS